MLSRVLFAGFVLLAACGCKFDPIEWLKGNREISNLVQRARALDPDAMSKLQERADSLGDPIAQVALGAFYDNGLAGLPKDSGKALIYFEKAQKSGSSLAAYNLGLMHYYGRGEAINPSRNKATALFQEAASAKSPIDLAMVKLGEIYEFMQNYEVAAIWYQKAAETSKDALACYRLGYFYYAGMGVPRDESRAISWLTRAAEQWHSDAQYLLGIIYSDGQNFSHGLTTAAKWLLISGRNNALYNTRAGAFAATLTKLQQDSARKMATLWIEAHRNPPPTKDYEHTFWELPSRDQKT